MDNGSSDGTAAVADRCGARVVREERRGYGRACLAGMRELTNPDIVVFLDGDNSDHPDRIAELIEPILADRADFVVGSRTLGSAEKGALSLAQRWGNRLAAALLNRLFPVKFTDLGPFRAVRWDVLQSLDMQDKSYGWTVEMQIKAAFQGRRVLEVPTPYRKRHAGKSKVSGDVRGVILASTYILFYIVAAAWQSLRARFQIPPRFVARPPASKVSPRP